MSSRACPQSTVANEPSPQPEGLSDQALLGAVGEGSKAALQELFGRHGAAVHRLGCLLVADGKEVDRLVEDVFVALWRCAGRLEDDIQNVRLGLLAMAWRRTPPEAEPGGDADGAAAAPRCLPSGDRDVLALSVLAGATLTEVALVLQADRLAVGARLRAGLRAVALQGEPAMP